MEICGHHENVSFIQFLIFVILLYPYTISLLIYYFD